MANPHPERKKNEYRIPATRKSGGEVPPLQNGRIVGVWPCEWPTQVLYLSEVWTAHRSPRYRPAPTTMSTLAQAKRPIRPQGTKPRPPVSEWVFFCKRL
jgi:hypothetical protein